LEKSLPSFKSFLEPEKIVHVDARGGAEFLSGLPDGMLADIFYYLMVRKVSPADLVRAISETGLSNVYEGHLTAILRRLSLVCIPLAKELDESRSKKPANPVLKLKVAPGSTTLREHLLEAYRADKNIDGVARMAGLTSLLWKQLETLYGHESRNMNPFMMLGQVNSAASLYMSALERLHKMQMDVGIVQKVSEKVEIDLQTVGAFQTYIGELDNGGKEEMIAFASSFRDLVRAKRVEAAGESAV
jgi:hypothetical protein